MKESKLGLDFKKIDYAKQIARNISKDVQTFVDSYSTVAVERTLCRLMGIDGVDSNDVPLPNVLVDFIKDGVKSVTDTVALFVFSILFFSVLNASGFLLKF